MNITDRLDRIADRLEKLGCVKEAHALDVISNTLEKIAYTPEMEPKYLKQKEAIEYLKNGNILMAKANLNSIEDPFEAFKSEYTPEKVNIDRMPETTDDEKSLKIIAKAVDSAYVKYRGARNMLGMMKTEKHDDRGRTVFIKPEIDQEAVNGAILNMTASMGFLKECAKEMENRAKRKAALRQPQ